MPEGGKREEECLWARDTEPPPPPPPGLLFVWVIKTPLSGLCLVVVVPLPLPLLLGLWPLADAVEFLKYPTHDEGSAIIDDGTGQHVHL